MKKVAIICHTDFKTDSRILRSVDSLTKQKDCHITIFLPNIDKQDKQSIPQGVQLVKYQLMGGWINRNILFARQYDDLLNLIRPHDFDLLICDNYPFLEIGITLKKQNPNLQVIYDSREWYMETLNQFFPTSGWKALYGIPLTIFNRWFHGRLEKKYAQQADHLITVCQTIATILSEKWNREVLVLRNVLLKQHVIAQENSLTEVQLPFEKDDIVMLYQGNLNPGRGLHILLRVMKQLPSKFKLIILGDGMLKMDLIAQKEALGLENVCFMDAVPYDKLLSITKQVDIGLSLIEPINESKRLSLPNKLFEYMSVGVPFLSSALPEPTLLVTEYDCGLLVDVNDDVAILKEILNFDKEVLKQKGSNGRKAFETTLNWETEYNLLLEKINI